jgi:hypothetical protein
MEWRAGAQEEESATHPFSQSDAILESYRAEDQSIINDYIATMLAGFASLIVFALS